MKILNSYPRVSTSHQQTGIEPGFLRVFRIYVLLRLFVVLIIYSTVTYILVGGVLIDMLRLVGIGLVGGMLLLTYLTVPAFRNYLKKYYLPIGLILATLDALVVEKIIMIGTAMIPTGFISTLSVNAATAASASMTLEIVPLSPPLFVVLILVSWQYSFRFGLSFALFTGLGDILYFAFIEGMTTRSLWISLTGIMPRTAALILISFIVTQLVSVQRQQRRELIAANAKIARYASTLESLAISRERNRMARELHDTLAHTLSASSVQLEAIGALMSTNPEKASIVLERAMEITRNGLQETRRALQDLRAAPLEDLGLGLALEDLVANIQPRTSAAIKTCLPDDLLQYPDAIQQMVYRISQEGLENAARHAQATRITLSLTVSNSHLDLRIEDDGVGFVQESINNNEHFGITGMIERANALGGRLTIHSVPQQGTQIHLNIGV